MKSSICNSLKNMKYLKLNFFPVLLIYNWHVTFCKFKVYNVMIWNIYVWRNVYHSKVSWHILHLTFCHFVLVVVRALKLHLYGNFQVYNTVLLSVFMMLCIQSSELFHLTDECLHPLTNIPPFTPTLRPWKLSCYSLFLWGPGCSIPYISEVIFGFLCLTSLT